MTIKSLTSSIVFSVFLIVFTFSMKGQITTNSSSQIKSLSKKNVSNKQESDNKSDIKIIREGDTSFKTLDNLPKGFKSFFTKKNSRRSNAKIIREGDEGFKTLDNLPESFKSLFTSKERVKRKKIIYVDEEMKNENYKTLREQLLKTVGK